MVRAGSVPRAVFLVLSSGEIVVQKLLYMEEIIIILVRHLLSLLLVL